MRSLSPKALVLAAAATAALVCVLLLAVGYNSHRQDGLRLAAAQTAAPRSRDFLTQTVFPDGHFLYEVDTVTGRITERYNIVRHAYVMTALANSLHGSADPAVLQALLAAERFMRDRYITAVPAAKDAAELSLVMTEPHESRRTSTAALGAQGLAVAALLSLQTHSPNETRARIIQGLGHSLLALQKDNGSFYPAYDPAKGVTDGDMPLYYPGEAVLGLLALHDADPAGPWRAAAERALVFLAQQPIDTAAPTDCWTLLAMARFLQGCNGDCDPSLQTRLTRHAAAIVQIILSRQQTAAPAHLRGGFDAYGDVILAATHVEALLAARDILPASKAALHRRITDSIGQGIDFILRAHVATGVYAGGTYSVMPDPNRTNAPGGILRMDGTAHVLATLSRYGATASHIAPPL